MNQNPLNNLHQQQQFQQQTSNLSHQIGFSPIGSPDLDRGGFISDGLVPGLRPSRARESSQVQQQLASLGTLGHMSMTNGLGEQLFGGEDDHRPQFNVQRVPSHQQALDQLHSRPIPQLYSNHAPGAVPRGLNGPPLGGGGFNGGGGLQQSGFRQSPNPQQQLRGFSGNNNNIAVGRGNFDLPFSGGNLPSGGPLSPQQLGGFNSGVNGGNAALGLGAGGGLPVSRNLSLPLLHQQQNSLGGGVFGNQPNGLDYAAQQQHQRELQMRHLLNTQQLQQEQLGGGMRNSGPNNLGRLLQGHQNIPGHHIQPQPQQPPQLRHQQHANALGSQGQGLPFNMLPHQMQHLGGGQQQQHLGGLGMNNDSFSHSLPPHLQQHPNHQNLGGFSGVQGGGGPQSQADLMALLMGGQHGLHRD